jgi:hypothetical protein
MWPTAAGLAASAADRVEVDLDARHPAARGAGRVFAW